MRDRKIANSVALEYAGALRKTAAPFIPMALEDMEAALSEKFPKAKTRVVGRSHVSFQMGQHMAYVTGTIFAGSANWFVVIEVPGINDPVTILERSVHYRGTDSEFKNVLEVLQTSIKNALENLKSYAGILSNATGVR